MRLLEHQAKKIFSSWGIPIPRSTLFSKTLTPAVLKKKVGSFPVILKAQVYAGGRGKGGGIVKIKDIKTLKTKAAALLERPLVTPQTGPGGVRVKSLLVEQGLRVQKEFYISILLDRSLGLPIMVASAEGGMSIEELAKKHPDKISRVPFDPVLGLYPFQARRIAQWMGIESSYQTAAQQQLVGLARGFLRGDASLAEINPWAVTKELGLVALDAKLTIDDNALYRHPKLQKLLTADADGPIEAKSRRIGINYVGLNGTVGCMVNGAGLAMATMDLIKLHGGEPANFLDVGGGANVDQVREAFKLILADPGVEVVLVNIFGGIMKCDVIAEGIIQAAKTIKIKVPLVVRLEGTNVEKGRAMLDESGLGFITAVDMDQAARKAVEAAQKR